MIAQAPSRDPWIPTTDEEREAILAELRRILDSPAFRSSRRYPAFLSFVVERTVAGKAEHLKERTLGIEVFERSPDYDTSADPIVRFTAGEVRKRIAQFYSTDAGQGAIKIHLPVGTYVPRFYRVSDAEEPQSVAPPLSAEPPSSLPPELAQRPAEPTQPNSVRHHHSSKTTVLSQEQEKTSPWFDFGSLRWSVVPILLALILSGVLGYRRATNSSPLTQVWAPMLRSSDAVLISAGRPHTDETEAIDRPHTTIRERILQPDFRVSMTTVTAISDIAGFLQTQHKSFRIHEAYSNSLADLRGRPVVLVNGNDNNWTLFLLRSCRFQFLQNGDDAYIIDRDHPERRDWKIDFGMPYLKQNVDYAVVARFHDATTGGPVMVVAGISANGTDAAGEFVVSPEELASLAKLSPTGRLDQNFEAVLKVEVVEGNTGGSTIVGSTFW